MTTERPKTSEYSQSNENKEGTHIPAIGIDLGTTYSCVAVFRNSQKAEIIPSEVGRNKIPSYIAYRWEDEENEGDDEEEEEEIVCGETAKDLANENVKGTIYDVKRMFGRNFQDPRLQRDIGFWPFDVIEESGEVKIKTGPASLQTPVQVTAELLKHLKDLATKYVNAEVSTAVVTVPAYFNTKQRQQTTEACALAGLNVLQLVNEPTAAAVAYNFHKKSKEKSPTNCLIFDFGGGTLDIAVLTISQNQIYVKAVGGDDHLGGEDIDNNLVEHCLQEFKKQHSVDIAAEKNSQDTNIAIKTSNRIRRLKNECQKQKEFLSQINQIIISINAMHGDKDLVVKVTRSEFDSINLKIFEKCIRLIETILAKAKIDRKEIDEVVLAGGSSRIPRIQEMISEHFGGKELCRSVDADEAVAVGASMLAFYAEHVEIPNILVQEEEFGAEVLLESENMTTLNTPLEDSLEKDGRKVYRALYDYEAQDNDEVSFIEDDLLINCTDVEEGWLTGTVERTGKRGMLPANFVTPEDHSIKPESTVAYRALYDYEAQDEDEISFIDGDLLIDCTAIEEGWLTATVQRTGVRGMLPANYVSPVEYPKKDKITVSYRALYDYEAQDEDEISFIDGDFLIDCTTIEEGWLTGTVERTGVRGMLPANYMSLKSES